MGTYSILGNSTCDPAMIGTARLWEFYLCCKYRPPAGYQCPGPPSAGTDPEGSTIGPVGKGTGAPEHIFSGSPVPLLTFSQVGCSRSLGKHPTTPSIENMPTLWPKVYMKLYRTYLGLCEAPHNGGLNLSKIIGSTADSQAHCSSIVGSKPSVRGVVIRPMNPAVLRLRAC